MLSKIKKIKIQNTPIVFLPKSLNEVEEIISVIKEKKPVIVNVLSLDTNNRYRIVDFLSGYIIALDGKREKLDECIYTFYIE